MNSTAKERANTVLTELLRFSSEICHLGDPIKDDRLERFEKQLGLRLPDDFKHLLKQHNSFGLPSAEVFGIGTEFGEQSLDKFFYFEHAEVENPMFPDFLPFSPDGMGNHYCLDLSRLENGLCPIVFWQHDLEYGSRQDVETCNANFSEWVTEVMIGWTLEESNYDGTTR